MSFVALMATAGLLVLSLATSLQAQRRGSSATEVINASRARVREETEYRRELDRAGKVGQPPAADDRQRLALMTQIREDFQLIQIRSNELITGSFIAQTPDFDELSEKAGEIKRRASRLKEHIKLLYPKDEKKEQRAEDAVDLRQLKSSLITLRNLITEFVTNPVFKNPGVIDIEMSTKAGRDLREIINLSDTVRKNAKQLDKAPK